MAILINLTLSPIVSTVSATVPLAVPAAEAHSIERGVPAQEIADALKRVGGHRTKAANLIGLTPVSIYNRIRNAPPDSPLARFKGKMLRPRAVRAIPEKVLADLLKKHGGDLRAVSKEPEILVPARHLRERIEGSSENSPLRRYKNVPARVVLDEEFCRALQACKGSRSQAADILEMTTGAVTHRIQRCRTGSPLEAFLTFCEKVRRGEKHLLTINLLRGLHSLSASPSQTGWQQFPEESL
ncbi:MAG: helix-turn-helix domain-containing protein [Deltaproteobacteria bacterium]|nr:helix-turn-helix domain-containing protein [Deltaproteobacteria bacterium]MDZ4225093.1 helix-turn-helix domain-containing protein [bacterium]